MKGEKIRGGEPPRPISADDAIARHRGMFNIALNGAASTRRGQTTATEAVVRTQHDRRDSMLEDLFANRRVRVDERYFIYL
jgi:hypothetical protein